MILLSDGEHNVPPPALKPRQAAQLAANLRIPIYVIDAAGDGGGVEGVDHQRLAVDAQNSQATLRALAQLTGGRYFPAHDSQSLVSVCGDIDHLERQEIQSFQYRRYQEAYAWFGFAALLLLAGLQFLEMTIWQRVP